MSDMELKNTEYEVCDGVATIWLNRPHRMNAWTGRVHTEYRYFLAGAERFVLVETRKR